MHRRRDQQRRDDGDEEEPPAVEPGAELAHVQEHPDEDDPTEHRDDVEHDAGVATGLPDQAPRRPDERERGAQHERGDARVGAVVDARRVGVGVVEDRHLDGGDRDRGEDGDEQRLAILVPHRQHEHQDQRPEEVELLLHRE
jgi:hypothetical protein